MALGARFLLAVYKVGTRVLQIHISTVYAEGNSIGGQISLACIANATWSRVASDQGLPMNWMPMGRPSLSCPTCKTPSPHKLVLQKHLFFFYRYRMFMQKSMAVTMTVMAGNPRKFPAMEYRTSAALDRKWKQC